MELISVHVPKTAGVTFRTLLLTVYGPAKVAFDYGDRALDPGSIFQTDPDRWQAEVDRQAALLSPQLRVIHGHFGGGKYDRAFPDACKIVWLREPVARLVSHYYYWRNLAPSPHPLHQRLLAEGFSLLEFARLEPMRNVLTNVFLRDCRLEDFAFIGIQEHFAADVISLGRLLQWPDDLKVGSENRNELSGYQRHQLTISEHAELAALNAKDIALYQQACALRGL